MPNQIQTPTDSKVDEIAVAIANAAKTVMPENTGYVIIAQRYGDASCVTNMRQHDLIRCLLRATLKYHER